MPKPRLAALAALVWICSFGVASYAQIPPPTDAEYAPPTLRIPGGSRPTHYELTLTVVPGEPKAPGEITIDIELDRPHPVLWLNADEIAISRASVSDAATEVTVLSGMQQFVGLAFKPALLSGRHRLTLAFEAEQTRSSTRGIFALKGGD